jgi:hypothetical protein
MNHIFRLSTSHTRRSPNRTTRRTAKDSRRHGFQDVDLEYDWTGVEKFPKGNHWQARHSKDELADQEN